MLLAQVDVALMRAGLVIDKSRPSSFYGTRLEPVLSGRQIRSLVICGVTPPTSAWRAPPATPASATCRST